MQTVRKVMRGAGRLAVFSLFGVLLLAAYHSESTLLRHYASKYDPFRFLLYAKRIMDLPPSNYIEGLFEYFYLVDLVYGAVTGLLILLGLRLGGWMMSLWYSLKLALYYLPHLFDTPRQAFKMSDRFEMMRQFALLGVAIALSCRATSSEKNRKLAERQQPIKQPEGEQPIKQREVVQPIKQTARESTAQKASE